MPGPITAMLNRNPKHTDRMPYAWNPDYPARIGVMPRDGGNRDIRWFDIEPCYVYHPLNAYTEDRNGAEVLVLDVVRYARMFDRDRRGPGDSPPSLDRWTVNLTTGSVTTECRDDRPQEFPRIDETRLGARHRFGYTVGFAASSPVAPTASSTSLYKHDYTTGATRVAPLDADLLLGEMSFVPNPSGQRRRRRCPDGIRLSPRPRRGPAAAAGCADFGVGGHGASAAAGADGVPRQLGSRRLTAEARILRRIESVRTTAIMRVTVRYSDSSHRSRQVAVSNVGEGIFAWVCLSESKE